MNTIKCTNDVNNLSSSNLYNGELMYSTDSLYLYDKDVGLTQINLVSDGDILGYSSIIKTNRNNSLFINSYFRNHGRDKK